MSEVIYSEEQKKIFEFAKYRAENLIVQAVAGAGKTTTLVGCVKALSDGGHTMMLLAHNKSTRDTLKERIGDIPNVRIFTLHGLAYRMFVEHFGLEMGSVTIDERKYRDYVNENLSSIASEDYHNLSRGMKLMYKATVFDLIDKARQNLKQSEKEIRKMATKKYGLHLVADEARVASEVLKWGSENRDVVDFQDLLWFPSEFGYFTKKYLADIIMLDEAQDASLAQQNVLSRCFKRNTRLFAFGDKDQMINNWCGSDMESFEHLKDSDVFRRPAKELPLSTNYRCGKKIIEYAKRYTDNNIQAREDAPDGVVRFDVSLREAKDGDMILCRNSAPLMEVYRRGIANGQKMYFRGEELGNSLIYAVDCADGDTIPEIIEDMKRRLIATWEYLTKETGLDPNETAMDQRVVSLLETIKTMENLPKTVQTRHDLEKFTKDVFSNEGRDGIQLSTIHRAKGLEADNVFIVCPSLIPSALARLDWQIEEERHLQYVMCTRPKNSLNFVTEKEVAPFVFIGKTSITKELEKIKDEVYSLKLQYEQ